VVVPQGSPADRIQAVRTLFPRFIFDQEKCYEGIECLKAYRREWSEERKDWLDRPRHDFASHAADALGCFAVGYAEQDTIVVHTPPRLEGAMPTGLRQGFWFR
jgi:hypothetical protein